MPLQRAVRGLPRFPDTARFHFSRQVAATGLHPGQASARQQLADHHRHQRSHRLALAAQSGQHAQHRRRLAGKGRFHQPEHVIAGGIGHQRLHALHVQRLAIGQQRQLVDFLGSSQQIAFHPLGQALHGGRIGTQSLPRRRLDPVRQFMRLDRPGHRQHADAVDRFGPLALVGLAPFTCGDHQHHVRRRVGTELADHFGPVARLAAGQAPQPGGGH